MPQTLPATPEVVWEHSVGFGLGSPVVGSGVVCYLDNQDGKETVHALALASGEEKWRVPLATAFQDTQSAAGPRSTPVIDGDRVYAQSCAGEFGCLDLAHGKPVWGVNFVRDFGAVFFGERGAAVGASRHGYTGCPVIDGDRILVGVGGTNGASVVCFGKSDGRVIWKSQDDVPGHSGPVLTTLAGVKQAVSFTAAGVMAVAARDGALLWRLPIKSSIGRHITTPVIVNGVVLVASHQAGLVAIRVSREGGAFKAEPIWAAKDLAINFSSPVAVGDWLYGVGPARNLVCVEVESGKLLWSKDGYFRGSAGSAYASFLVFGDRVLMLTDGGELVLLAADPKACRELSRAQVCGANWCNPAYAEGRLYLRDAKTLRCVRLIP